MRIAYFIHDNKKGGAAVSFIDMIRGLAEQCEVFVFTPHKKGYIPEELDRLGIHHKAANYFWWEIAKTGNRFRDYICRYIYWILNCYNHIEARRIARMVSRMEIDIIHSNSSTINIGALISELTGIKHIWHLRELALPEYPLYPVRRSDSMNTVLNIGNNVYIAISNYTADFYSHFIKRSDNILVIYNGINSSYNYIKTDSDYNSNFVSFLISGNYCEEKGQIDVAHAVGLLVSQGVTGFRVYMAGRGDFKEVRDFLEKNGLNDYVIFCGLVDDMLSLRKKCDVEIVASRTEAFGRVTIEAMRASNPVIGSATGGTTELIEDGVNGFLYKYKDDNALAECMKKFITDPHLAQMMGQKAYKRSVDRFTIEDNVGRVMALYESIAVGE